MKKKELKEGIFVSFCDMPDEIGEIIEIGNDYIHIYYGEQPFDYKKITGFNVLTIGWTDIKDLNIVENK